MSKGTYNFNLNNHITVKLKDKGIHRIVMMYNIPELPEKHHISFSGIKDKINDDGTYSMQTTDFLKYFGGIDIDLLEHIDLNVLFNPF